MPALSHVSASAAWDQRGESGAATGWAVETEPPAERADPVGEPREARPRTEAGTADAVIGDLDPYRPVLSDEVDARTGRLRT